MAISDFRYFSILTPKAQTFDFSKMNAYKIQNFLVIQKTRRYVVKLHINNKHTKCQGNVFFGCAVVKKKTGKVDDVTFWNAFLAFLIDVRKNKSHFWNPETKLDMIGMFCRKFKFEVVPNLTLIWPEIDLFWGRI